MTQVTPEEIMQRKSDSLKKRENQKKAAAEIRAKDKAIAKKMHENRSKILFTSPIPYVTLAAFKTDIPDTLTVFWTVKHQGERDSFKLAKKYLGRAIEEGRQDRSFRIELPITVDAYTLEYLVNWNFFLRVISGEVKVPRYIRKEISQKLARENF